MGGPRKVPTFHGYILFDYYGVVFICVIDRRGSNCGDTSASAENKVFRL